MTVLLLLHAIVGLAIIVAGRSLGRRALVIGVVPLLVTLAWLAVQMPDVLDGGAVTEQVTWVDQLGLALDFRLDGFAALMVLLVSGIGALVFAYGGSYFPRQGDGLGRLIGLLVLFAGSMLGLVLADNLLLLYVCWELTSITSYLLIGNDHDDPIARAAALQALLITSAGGLAMLGGFVLIGQAAGTYSIHALVTAPPGGAAVTAGLVLVLLGILTKSAQYPFHSWLPAAMVAPTPVSTYLHSATMVKAGIYLAGRFSPAFGENSTWRAIVVIAGVTTMVLAALRALRQYDLKLLLAFGTVSQLGFLLVLFGVGTPEATTAGVAMIFGHALFKAAEFMSVGIIDHQTGTRDIREIPRLGAGWGPLTVVAVVASASMAGVPLVFGFVAKEEAYASIADGGFALHGLTLFGLVLGSVLTFAYAARLLWGAFVAPRFADPHHLRLGHSAPAPSAWFVAPPAVLAGGMLVLGLVPGLGDRFLTAAAQSLDPEVHDVHLALWHGVNLPLALSALTLAAGLLVFLFRHPLAKVLAVGARVPSGVQAYLAGLRALNWSADRLTSITQPGSLPVYAGVILFTAAALPGVALLSQGDWPGLPDTAASASQVVVSALVLVAALAASVTRRRFAAALLLGTVGYGMAGLFIIQGAPDLALTQVAIETLSTVLFVLGLRRLPDRFEHRPPRVGRVLRFAVAASVGLVVFAFAITAQSEHRPSEVSQEMVESSVPEGHGRNVVNVILVDFRGLDTLGEITVLAVAAIGAVAVARAGRRPGDVGKRPDRAPAGDGAAPPSELEDAAT